jgi:hypothetical protein
MKYLQTILVSLVLLAAVAGCSQHGDLPTDHGFIPAPAVSIDAGSVVDNGDGTYVVPFSVADAAAVQYYRVYLYNPLTGLMEMVGTVDSSPAPVDLQTGQSVAGYPVGVSAVTVENIEGAMAVVLTP